MNDTGNDIRHRKAAAATDGENRGSLPNVHNYGSAAEYAEAVRAWLWAYHNWQLSQCLMPFMLQQYQMGIAVSSSNQGPPSQPTATQLSTNLPVPGRGIQYTLPHFGRRILAEIVDGLLCFAISLILTFIFVEIGIINAEKYEKILNYEADLKIVINITQDLFPLEIIKRLLTSFIEALYLSRGVGSVPAGQTPGKFLLGLKVIPCEEISFVSARRGLVSVYSIAPIVSFKNAFVRSLIKNFAMGFLFPLCVVMYTFRFNRAVYDLAAETVVVEA